MKDYTIDKDILRLAAPAIINNITVPLLGLCDTAISGHLGSAKFLGAISIGTMMLNVFFWLAGFLRMGTTGLTARSVGRGSVAECREVIVKSLIIAAGISIAVIIFQNPILDFLLHFISPEGEAAGLAAGYFRIGVWWVPAQLTIMAVSGWFIGLQTTVVPMTLAITANIINIISSIILAFGLRMGFEGIAYGTLTANWIGAVIAVVWGYSRLRKMDREAVEESETTPSEIPLEKGRIKWSEFFSVNGALLIRSACIMAVTLTVTSIGARLGELTLAANAVIMQFFFFFSYFMDGFAFSGEALAGRFSGAGKRDMIIRTMRRLCVWGAVMAALFFSIYYFWSGEIASIITDTEAVVREISRYRIWILLLPPVTVAAFIFDGLFVGLTKTRDMMWVTIGGAGTFFILLFLSGLTLTNNLLWLAFEAYLFIRGGALALIFINKFAKKKAY